MTTVDSTFTEESMDLLLERLRREPALRSWVLNAPTGALASLGITLDDNEVVDLLDRLESMEDRPLPITAKDVMTPNPITVTPQNTAHEAAQILSERHISGLPVKDSSGTLVGIVSEFDLIARSGRTVAEVMSHDIVSVPETASLESVRAIFVSRMLKRVPVVDAQGHLTGLISRADLVRELAYRWACKRCQTVVRSRRPPEGCEKCGASDSFEPAPLVSIVATCPTCGHLLEGS